MADYVGRIRRSIFLLFPAIGILGPTVAYHFEYTNLAIIGLYASFPLISAPLFYYFSSRNNRVTNSVVLLSDIEVERRVFIIIILLLFSLLIYSSISVPRRTVFFVTFSGILAIILVYSISKNEKSIPLLFLFLLVVTFHLSSTLGPAYYLGSGDTVGIQLSIGRLIQSGSFGAISAGYSDFPNFFILLLFAGSIIGSSGTSEITTPVVPLFLSTALITGMGVWFMYFTTKKLDILPERFVILPSVLLCLSTVYWQIGLISLPRSMFSFLAILPVSIIAVQIFSSKLTSKRFVALLVLTLTSLVWYHKIAQVFVILITFISVVTYILLNWYQDDFKLRRTFDYLRINKHVIIPVFVIFLIMFLYNSMQAGYMRYVLIRWFMERNTSGFSAVVTRFAVDPVPVLMTFGSTSFLLFLYLIGLFDYFFQVADKNDHGRQTLQHTVVISVLFAPFYFPNPINLSNTLMAKLQLYRLREISYIFIILIVAFGFYRVWVGNNWLVRALLLTLFFTAGLFAVQNDIYTRDNPLAKTGLHSNYLTETEVAAANHGLAKIDGHVTADGFNFDRLLFEKSFDLDSKADPIYAYSVKKSLNSTIIVRSEELVRRSNLIFRFGKIDDEREIPKYFGRHKIYANGGTHIVSEWIGSVERK